MSYVTQSIAKNDLFRSIMTKDIFELRKLFDHAGHKIRIAGGAPRDILNGKLPHDLDFATDATPDEMLKIFEAQEIRMVNANGAG